MPLSEFLLPATLETEPRLAVTGLVIVCIIVRADGMPCLERGVVSETGRQGSNTRSSLDTIFSWRIAGCCECAECWGSLCLSHSPILPVP